MKKVTTTHKCNQNAVNYLIGQVKMQKNTGNYCIDLAPGQTLFFDQQPTFEVMDFGEDSTRLTMKTEKVMIQMHVIFGSFQGLFIHLL